MKNMHSRMLPEQMGMLSSRGRDEATTVSLATPTPAARLDRHCVRCFAPELHGADCAEAIARALEVAHPSGAYFVAEPAPYLRRDMARHIGAAVGRSVRVVPVPPLAMQAIGAAAELAGRLRDRPVMLSRDKAADATQRHQSCDPRRAMATLDWAPRHDFERGARDAYADYQRRGWL